MKLVTAQVDGTKAILEGKEAELARVLRKRDGIEIEKSADQMDEIQFASERDLAIQNADRDSHLLREVRAALRRIGEGSFGVCIDCDGSINPKRLAVVPWAARCIECQETHDRNGQPGSESLDDELEDVA